VIIALPENVIKLKMIEPLQSLIFLFRHAFRSIAKGRHGQWHLISTLLQKCCLKNYVLLQLMALLP